MKLSRYILILCVLLLSTGKLDVVAQESQEQMAAYYYDNGELEQAAQLYESLYKRTTNKFYYQRLYNTYFRLGEYKDALKLAEKRRKENPKDLYLYVDEGNVYLEQGQKKKADKVFDKAVDAITGNLAPIPDLARAFSNVGRYDYALKTYYTARSKTKNKQLYLSEIVGVYQAMGDYGAMTEEYFDLLDNSPGYMSSIQLSLQRVLAETSSPQVADGLRSALVQRVQRHPENKQYLEMMIWFSMLSPPCPDTRPGDTGGSFSRRSIPGPSSASCPSWSGRRTAPR